MAGVVDSIGRGGQRWVETRLGWNRQLIRKGEGELDSGVDIVDRVSQRGRKKAEEIHPHLLRDIRAIADPNSQTDPSFRSTRLYVRITASEVHRRLKDRFGYDAERMPCVRTVNSKLNFLKLHPRKVAKSKPLKKIKETDAIFEMVHEINALADSDPRQLRISMDTKATVKIGEFSRAGYRRGGASPGPRFQSRRHTGAIWNLPALFWRDRSVVLGKQSDRRFHGGSAGGALAAFGLGESRSGGARDQCGQWT